MKTPPIPPNSNCIAVNPRTGDLIFIPTGALVSTATPEERAAIGSRMAYEWWLEYVRLFELRKSGGRMLDDDFAILTAEKNVASVNIFLWFKWIGEKDEN